MTIYLSGPITGIRNNNKRAFGKAYNKIVETFVSGKQPFSIINPLNIAALVDARFKELNKNLYQIIRPQWADYMRADIKKLCEADCVYFLKGWGKSKGSVLERYIAETLGIPCVETIEDLKKIKGGNYENQSYER